MCVGLHVINSKSNSLFQKAILMNGAALQLFHGDTIIWNFWKNLVFSIESFISNFNSYLNLFLNFFSWRTKLYNFNPKRFHWDVESYRCKCPEEQNCQWTISLHTREKSNKSHLESKYRKSQCNRSIHDSVSFWNPNESKLWKSHWYTIQHLGYGKQRQHYWLNFETLNWQFSQQFRFSL